MDYNIEEYIWKKIYSFLKEIDNIHTKNEAKLRKFVEAVWYMIRTGSQWRALSREKGHWRSVHKRYKEWCHKNIWRSLMENFIDPDNEYTMIDSTIVRAHACAAGSYKYTTNKEALGRSKGGFTTKIHVATDALGNPLRFTLTPGNKHDITQAATLLKNIKTSYVIADKGYTSKKLHKLITSNNAISVIPSRSNAKSPQNYDKHIYKERHLVENFFSKIKHYRRIFSRYDKSAHVFLSSLYFVGALIWLK